MFSNNAIYKMTKGDVYEMLWHEITHDSEFFYNALSKLNNVLVCEKNWEIKVEKDENCLVKSMY